MSNEENLDTELAAKFAAEVEERKNPTVGVKFVTDLKTGVTQELPLRKNDPIYKEYLKRKRQRRLKHFLTAFRDGSILALALIGALYLCHKTLFRGL